MELEQQPIVEQLERKFDQYKKTFVIFLFYQFEKQQKRVELVVVHVRQVEVVEEEVELVDEHEVELVLVVEVVVLL